MKGPKPYHEATPQEATRNGLLPGEWRETKYPGDAAVNLDVVRDGEMGMIRIQVYGPESYMVASYTPGYQTGVSRGLPSVGYAYRKQWCVFPDEVTWCKHKGDADRQFAVYVIGAFRAGWKAEKPGHALNLLELVEKPAWDIPHDKSYPSDAVQCDQCGGWGCGVCETKGWLPAGHARGRKCRRDGCNNPIPPSQVAVYCSNNCAIKDA